MKAAPSVYWTKDWQAAVDEAVRRNQVCRQKFGEGPWVYRVRRRRVGRHLAWRVYVPTGRIPR